MKPHPPMHPWSPCCCAFGAGPVDTLTVYRIGGEKLPVPNKANQEGIDFVQLSWAEVDVDLFGSHRYLEIGESVTPVRLDPEVNMGPRIRELGGRILFYDAIDGWEEDPRSQGLAIMDGDYGTAFQGNRDLTPFSAEDPFSRAIWIDFASLLPIRRVVFQPRPEFLKRRFVRDFIIGTNDGDVRKRGTGRTSTRGDFRLWTSMRSTT